MAAVNRDSRDAFHDGVLDALMHVASVSALDARELVIEFDAADAATRVKASADGDAAQPALADAFREGLSTERLKIIAAHYWRTPSSAELSRLRRTLELLKDEHSSMLPAYCGLVREAAHAAARAATGKGFREGHYLTLLERAALREVDTLLSPATRKAELLRQPRGRRPRPEVQERLPAAQE